MGILKWEYQTTWLSTERKSPQCNSCEFSFIQALTEDYGPGTSPLRWLKNWSSEATEEVRLYMGLLLREGEIMFQISKDTANHKKRHTKLMKIFLRYAT